MLNYKEAKNLLYLANDALYIGYTNVRIASADLRDNEKVITELKEILTNIDKAKKGIEDLLAESIKNDSEFEEYELLDEEGNRLAKISKANHE